jgi:hypothetical protein
MSDFENEWTIEPESMSEFIHEIKHDRLIDQIKAFAADLKLEFPQDWIIPNQPVNNQPATIRFRIRNEGQTPALDFKTHLFMDGVKVGTWEFIHIDYEEDTAHQYQPLLPGQATRIFKHVTPPLDGTHIFSWHVDPEGQVFEQNEANNIYKCSISWISNQKLPDLLAELIEPYSPVEIGLKSKLKVKIKNQGQTGVNCPFWVFVKLNGKHIITKEVQKLGAGESIILEDTLTSVSKKNKQLEVIVDGFNEINESDKSNNSFSMGLVFDSVSLEVDDWRAFPSTHLIGRPVMCIDIRNNGEIDATRPFSVHVTEINGGTAMQVEKIDIKNYQLPKAGEILSITLPIQGWEFEPGKIHIATKDERRFLIQVDPDWIYQKTVENLNHVLAETSVFDIYKPWLISSEGNTVGLPDAYFFRIPEENRNGNISKRTFAYVEISERSGGGGGVTGGPGSSEFNPLRPFIETAKWFYNLFNDTEDDKVRDVINRSTPQQIRALSIDQLLDMVKKLFDGPTLDDDENAFNKILEALSPKKFMELVEKLGGLSNIDDEIDGSEWNATLRIATQKAWHLSQKSKLKLIKGLFDTTTYDAEERAIIDIVKTMSSQQQYNMLQTPGFSKEDFDDQVDGSEWDELEKILDQAKPVMKNQSATLLGRSEVTRINFSLEGMAINQGQFNQIKAAIQNDKIMFVHDQFSGLKAKYFMDTNEIRSGTGAFLNNEELEQKMVHELTHAIQDMTMPGQTKVRKHLEAAAYLAQALFIYYTNETEVLNGTFTPDFAGQDVFEEAWKLALIAVNKQQLTPNDYRDLLRAIEALYGTQKANEQVQLDGL